MAITVGGTSITFNDATTQSSAGITSAVTSVATGNGLQGGTITTTGTLSVACPGFNTVGSYVTGWTAGTVVNSGQSLSSGISGGQIQSGAVYSACGVNLSATNNLSGTWRWMGANTIGYTTVGLACRIS